MRTRAAEMTEIVPLMITLRGRSGLGQGVYFRFFNTDALLP
jgi:hypothetical protein